MIYRLFAKTIAPKVSLRANPKAVSTSNPAIAVLEKGTLLRVKDVGKKNYYETEWQNRKCYVYKTSVAAEWTTIKPTDSMSRINALLAQGGNFKFVSGIYKIIDRLIIHSNSLIVCEGAIFKRMCGHSIFRTEVGDGTTKYNGVHDVEFYGGEFWGDGCNDASNMIDIIHSNHIVIDGLDMHKAMKHHFIEINSSHDVIIRNCSFSDHVDDPEARYKEAIQIDFAYHGGLAFTDIDAKTYDGTHCSDITIENNKFINNYVAIGTHTRNGEDAQHHENIIIRSNTAIGKGIVPGGSTGSFVRAMNMRHLVIEDNIASNFGCFVLIQEPISGKCFHGGSSRDIKYPYACEDIIIRRNTISNCVEGLSGIGVITSSNNSKKYKDISVNYNTFNYKGKKYIIVLRAVDGYNLNNNHDTGKYTVK